MSFDFLVRDDNNFIYRATIDDDGEISLLLEDGTEPDMRAFLSLEAVGGGSPILYENIHTIWADILDALRNMGELDEFLDGIRKHNTEQGRWVSTGPWYDRGSEYEKYIYEFSIDSLIAYLGPTIPHLIRDGSGTEDILLIATLIKAIQGPDGTDLEFDMEDAEDWEEGTNLPSYEMWASLDRTIYADGQEVFEYPADFTRKVYDEVTLDDAVDEWDAEKLIVASSDALKEIIRIFGLQDKKDKLDEKARKKVPEIDKPESDEEGLWGVLYEYEGYQDWKIGKFVEEPYTKIVPYYSIEDAEKAIEIASDFMDERAELHDPELSVVRRESADSDEWF